tara:strand:- start:1315 stop:1605 length:291 start_codon:yes stop_codon:yes gene_type:complete
MSKGYWVVRANVFDKEKYSEYINLATDIIKKFDGKFIVRGGIHTEFEKSGYSRTVVVEFHSYQVALDCYNSRDYQSALKFVKNSSERLVAIVEGIN